MFLTLLFILWLVMIIFSVIVGMRGSQLFQFQLMVNFSRKGIYNYTFGVHHTASIGHNDKGGCFRMESLSIGIIFFSVELNFYKDIKPGNTAPDSQ